MRKNPPVPAEELIALLGTYGDGRGGTVDWSGITALGICQCGQVLGPFLDEAETKSELARHRLEAHPEGLDVSVDRTCKARGCTTAARAKGLCHAHLTQARQAWADAMGDVRCQWAEEPCDRGALVLEMCTRHYNMDKRRRARAA